MVFGPTGSCTSVLGAGGGMLADRFGPRAVCSAGMLHGAYAAGAAGSMATIYAAYGAGGGWHRPWSFIAIDGLRSRGSRSRRGSAAGIMSSGIGARGIARATAGRLGERGPGGAARRCAPRVGRAGRRPYRDPVLRRAPMAANATGGCLARSRPKLCDARFWWLYLEWSSALRRACSIPFAHRLGIGARPGIDASSAPSACRADRHRKSSSAGSRSARLADRIGRIADAGAGPDHGRRLLIWQAAGGYPALVVRAVVRLSYGGIVRAAAGAVHGPFRRTRSGGNFRDALHRRGGRQFAWPVFAGGVRRERELRAGASGLPRVVGDRGPASGRLLAMRADTIEHRAPLRGNKAAPGLRLAVRGRAA